MEAYAVRKGSQYWCRLTLQWNSTFTASCLFSSLRVAETTMRQHGGDNISMYALLYLFDLSDCEE